MARIATSKPSTARGIRTPHHLVALPQEFLAHASRAEVLESVGITAQAVARATTELVLSNSVADSRALDDAPRG